MYVYIYIYIYRRTSHLAHCHQRPGARPERYYRLCIVLVYIYIYIYIYIIHIYIYIHRERERDTHLCMYIHTHMYVSYIYIYIHIHIYTHMIYVLVWFMLSYHIIACCPMPCCTPAVSKSTMKSMMSTPEPNSLDTLQRGVQSEGGAVDWGSIT